MAKRSHLVVIVDNDEAVRDALRFVLRIEGFCVHVHGGAATLLQDPDLSRARCVILDERMRNMDGFSLLDALQARNLKLPAIMLTSNATARLLERAVRIGVRNVLEKPLLDNVLLETIRGIVAEHSDADT